MLALPTLSLARAAVLGCGESVDTLVVVLDDTKMMALATLLGLGSGDGLA